GQGHHEAAEPTVGNIEPSAALLPPRTALVDQLGLQRAGRTVVGDRDARVALARALADVGLRFDQADTGRGRGEPTGDRGTAYTAADDHHVKARLAVAPSAASLFDRSVVPFGHDLITSSSTLERRPPGDARPAFVCVSSLTDVLTNNKWLTFDRQTCSLLGS